MCPHRVEWILANSVTPTLSERFQTVFWEASRVTGAGFDFLLQTAKRESALRTDAKAPTSSATGLFQFVEQTWLETVKQAGPQLGYGKQAAKITQVGDRYYVRDPQDRQAILNLRKDAKASALMAGAYARKNEALLGQRLGRRPTQGELYAAHFLGAKGGGQLIELASRKPNLSAEKIFPEQARANRNIFYERNGKARSVRQVYDNLVATVPNAAPTIPQGFDLGNRFNAKASVTAQPVLKSHSFLPKGPPIEQFFAKPGLPSRFGLGYSPSSSQTSAARPSRLLQGQDGAVGVKAATMPRAGRSSRYVNPAVGQEMGKADGSEMPLPRRKPITADLYVKALDGATTQNRTPKAKVSGGALDLTSFLKKI